MRRRAHGGRTLSAEEVVGIYERAVFDTRGASSEVQRHAIHEALAEHGYTPLDAIRARYWLRRGAPPGYLWDVAEAPPNRWRL